MSGCTYSWVLMAGGQSRRMGMDKAVVAWKGEPLWRRQAAVLREAGAGEVWVAAARRPAWLPTGAGWVWVEDAVAGRGPLGGLAAALGRLEATHLVVLAIDLPCMTAAYLRGLMATARPGRGVVAERGGWYEPLAAVYPREAASEAEALLAGQDHSLQRLLGRLVDAGRIEVQPIGMAEEGLFFNCNESGDVR